MVPELIEGGADVTAKNNYGNTPLHDAVSFNRFSILPKLLEKSADVNAQNELGETPLHIAAANGRQDIVNLLVFHNADVNIVSVNGRSPLHAACEYGDKKVIDTLAKAGADVNAKIKGKDKFSHNQGETPLHIAAYAARDSLVELLVSHGANVNALNDTKRTPLHAAAIAGDDKAIETLVKAGANVDAKAGPGDFGYTALHFTINNGGGNPSTVKALLDGKADTNVRDTNGQTPLEAANERTDKTIANMIEEHEKAAKSQEKPVKTHQEKVRPKLPPKRTEAVKEGLSDSVSQETGFAGKVGRGRSDAFSTGKPTGRG